MKLYWVRHGESEHNKLNIWNDDPSKKFPLTKKGKEQANFLANKLKEINIDIIFTSEFFRTKQTAEIINKFHNVSMVENKLINERKAGYDGKPFFEILPLLRKDILGEGGETIEEFKKRVCRFIENIKSKRYKSITIVSHEAVLQVVNGVINNLSNEELRKQHIEYTDIIEQEI